MNGLNHQPTASSSPVEKLKETSHTSVFAEAHYFNAKMYSYFQSGRLPQEFAPYFEWKFVHQDIKRISRETAIQMTELAQELLEGYYDQHPEAFTNVELYHYDPANYDIEESLWCSYKGFKGDMYTVSFLEKIDGELLDCLIGDLFD